jgi:hypothetical protein
MARTTFSGPVASDNGFIGGTASSPIAVTTASNVSSSYVTASNTTGDVRLNYSRLEFTSTGSGETARFLTRVTGANGATGGTINGAHISLSINGSGTISGAGNALRVTLGGSSTNPGGTIAAIQVDSDFATGGTWTNASYLRFTNSGTGTIGTLFTAPAAMFQTATTPTITDGIAVKDSAGNTYYLLCSTALS